MTQVIVLHVTDVHIKSNAAEPIKRAGLVGPALANKFDVNSSVIIALGGDIAFQGNSEQYVLATQFLNTLKSSLQTAGFVEIHVVATPGNHDCDFSLQDKEGRKVLWETARDPVKAVSLFKSMAAVQGAFHEWDGEVSSPGKFVAPSMKRTQIRGPVGEIFFDSLNTSWSTLFGEREGHLIFCEVDAPRLGEGTISVLIAHHPPNWFQQEHKVSMQRWIDETYDLVLYGHEHYNDEMERRSRHTGAAISIVAGSAFHSSVGSNNDGFSVIVLDASAGMRISQLTYRWTGEKFLEKGQLTVRDFEPNPAKLRPRRSFKKSFLDELEDPGMQLSHPKVNRPIRLSELMIEPRLLLEVPSNAVELDPSQAVPAISLLRNLDESKAVNLIFGPELSGKSTLCKFLCTVGQSEGLIPLWLNVASLPSINAGDITAWINRAIAESFVGEAEAFYQSSIDERIILLDGLERLRGSASSKIDLIERCLKLSKKVIVVFSASSSTEGLMLLGRGERKIPDADIYDIAPLSKQTTRELLRRWYALGGVDGVPNETLSDMEARCRQVATRMSTMMGRHGLPPFPISVLLLVQLTEAMRESDAIVADGSFGYIMDSLIVTEMQRANVSVPLSIAIGYLAEFAWFLESSGMVSVDEENFSAFHNQFEAAHGLTVSEDKISAELFNARFLTVEPGSIRFRYPYLFHFFLAKHLAGIYSSDSGKSLVDSLIKYIHTDKSASVLTFLAHFSSEVDLVDRLLDRAETIHPTSDLADFWTRSTMFSRFNSLEAKQELLEYDSKTAEEEIADEELESDFRGDGVSTHRDMFPDEDDPARWWTGALKSIHVLGQVLRSRSTRMDVGQKTAVVNACIRVARRTLGFAFEELERDAPAIVQNTSGAFERLMHMNRDKAARRANSVLGWLVVAFSCTYIFRVGRACGADEFSALNSSLLSKAKDKNDKLFLLCARLLGERRLVETELIKIYEAASDSDILPAAIIRRLARYRLHISPPADGQRRRIARKMMLGNTASFVPRGNSSD